MSEIVISGYYGFANAGDEAMLAAMIEAFNDLEPGIGITVISGNTQDTRRRHGVKAVYRLNYSGIIKVLLQSDILISGGGSLLQDVTSNRSLYYYLSIVMLAKKLRKPVMLYAQGIGPVRGSMAQNAMRYIGNMVDLITVRDEGSRDELKFLGVNKPQVHVTADPVLAMHPVDKEIGRVILRRNSLEGATPLVGFCPREWKDWAHYKQVLAETADALVQEFGARIVFLPMQWPDDFDVARKIVRRMKKQAIVLPEEYTTTEMLSVVGNLDMLIGVRLHALIFAAVMGVPLVGVSYDPKIDRFLETIGQHHAGTLRSISKESLVHAVRDIWPDVNNPNGKRQHLISALREKAFQNAELALSLIEKSNR